MIKVRSYGAKCYLCMHRSTDINNVLMLIHAYFDSLKRTELNFITKSIL